MSATIGRQPWVAWQIIERDARIWKKTRPVTTGVETKRESSERGGGHRGTGANIKKVVKEAL